MSEDKDNLDLYQTLSNIKEFDFDDVLEFDSLDDDDVYSDIFDHDVDFDIALSGPPMDDYDEVTIEDKIMKLSDELAEEIVIYNIMDQIDNNAFIYNNVNYIDLFIKKYERLKNHFSEPMDEGLKKEHINRITSNLIEVVLLKLEDKFGISMGYDLDNEAFLSDALKDLSTIYEFFVLRNKDNIVSIFMNDLESDLMINKFVEMLEDVELNNDVFIKEDNKKNIDKRLMAVMYFTMDIINELTTTNSDSLYALVHRIINLDYYEELNMKMNELLTVKFGNEFVIVDHDEEAAKKFFGLIYDDTAKSTIAANIINKYHQKIELENQ